MCDGRGRGVPLGLDVPLEIERQVQLWFEAEPAADYEALVPFNCVLPGVRHSYYAMPRLDADGIKVCRHQGGAVGALDDIDRTTTAIDEEDVRSFMRERLPG